MAKREPKSRTLFNNLVKDLTDLELILLRDRVVTMADEILNDKEGIREKMRNHIISPELYIRMMETIKNHLKYE